MTKRSFGMRSTELTKKGQHPNLDLNWDNDIESSDEEENYNERRSGQKNSTFSSDSEDELTVEQKRKKIAQEYLASMTSGAGNSSDCSDDDNSDEMRGNISQKLSRARLESQGKYFSEISEGVSACARRGNNEFTTFSGHQLAVTSVAITSDESTVYSGSKDNSIIRWDIHTGAKSTIKPKWRRKTHDQLQCHEGEVLSLAISSDNRYLVSGGRENTIRIYDTRLNESGSEIHVFNGHRGAVTSLSFQKDSYSLFSGSSDRTIKHWDLNEMGYLETLFGHQDAVNSLDCWTKQRPLSSSSDRSLRMWKVSEDSHLVFRGHKASIDNVQYLTQDSYMSTGQDGSVCIWKETQKKPVACYPSAHGNEQDTGNVRWISALSCCTMTDFAATGSYDGFLRLWKANAENGELHQTASLEMGGFINSIALSKKLIVCGVGNEHRLGRWWRLNGVKNCVKVMNLHNLSNESDVDYMSSEDDCESG